jgi:hypothetical protein
MEVERFKHRQLAPTVGPSPRSSGEFEGHYQKNQSAHRVRRHRVEGKVVNGNFSFERKQAQARIRIKAGSSTTNWSPVSL